MLLLPAGKLAGNVINHLTGENPSYFSNTRILLSGLTGTGLIIFVCVGIILITVFLYVSVISLLNLAGLFGLRISRLEKAKLGIVLGRSHGGITLMGILLFIFIRSTALFDYTPQLLVVADYYAKSPCINQNPSEMVAFLDRDQISVAVPTETGSYRFERRTCEKPAK